MALVNETVDLDNDLFVFARAVETRPQLQREIMRAIRAVDHGYQFGCIVSTDITVFISLRGAVRLERKLDSDRELITLGVRRHWDGSSKREVGITYRGGFFLAHTFHSAYPSEADLFGRLSARAQELVRLSASSTDRVQPLSESSVKQLNSLVSRVIANGSRDPITLSIGARGAVKIDPQGTLRLTVHRDHISNDFVAYVMDGTRPDSPAIHLRRTYEFKWLCVPVELADDLVAALNLLTAFD